MPQEVYGEFTGKQGDATPSLIVHKGAGRVAILVHDEENDTDAPLISAAEVPTLADVLGTSDDADGNTISNLADPAGAQDVDTKAARDAAIAAVDLNTVLEGMSVPVVPLTTPAVQDVIDALVTLGLVTQSD